MSGGGPAGLDRARRLGHRWEGRPSPPTLGERVLALADPTVEAGDAFFGRDEDYEYPTLGFTSRVRDHEGPDIDYNAVQGPQGWTATPTMTAASDEGTNDCWALGQGTHRVPGETVQDKPLYVEVGAERAAEIKAAEDEHVADYRYAKAQVLDVADAWLGDRLNQRVYGPAASKDAVEARVDNDLDAGMKAAVGVVNDEYFSWANVGSAYGRATAQTVKRDEAGWHSFGQDQVVEEHRVVERITVGTTAIGNHDSASVIKLDEVT